VRTRYPQVLGGGAPTNQRGKKWPSELARHAGAAKSDALAFNGAKGGRPAS
jgi:hypothetical protein